MYDVKCPYCGTEQEINHDDGYGFEEDGEYEQGCVECDREFIFTTCISYDYRVYCKDEKDHEMEIILPEHPDYFSCKNCEHTEFRKAI